jgi:hypothetical protein
VKSIAESDIMKRIFADNRRYIIWKNSELMK